MSRALASLVIIGSALIVVACRSDPATAPAPGPEAGVYVARTLDGKPIPALIDSGAVSFDVMDADTVVLDGLGGAVRASTSHSVSPTYGTSSYHFHTSAEYRLFGDSIEVGYFRPCPPGALCVPNETGRLQGAALTLGRFYSFHEAFVRVQPPGRV